MSKIKTAVVILNWNGEKLLPKFLPSVIKHTDTLDTEIIIVDNKSTDLSVNIIKQQFQSVRLIKFTENYGFAKGYNKALKHIDAQYYILLNSDVEVSSNWLQPLIEAMDKDPKLVVVQPKILSYNNPNYFEYGGAAGGMLDKLGYPYCYGRIFKNIEKDNNQYNEPKYIQWASGACLAIKASTFHDFDGFDSDFWAHMEEIDLCWRIKNSGYKIKYIPTSIVYHLGGGSLSYDNPQKLFLNFRNSLFMLYKNTPKAWLYFIILVRISLDVLVAFIFLLSLNFKGFRSVFKAHLDFYSSLSTLSIKRKLITKKSIAKWHLEMPYFSIIFRKIFGFKI